MVAKINAGGNARDEFRLDEELQSLVSSIENDPEVQKELDGLPLPSAETGGTIMYRDADDVTTINRLTWVTMILSPLLALSMIWNLGMYLRKPSLIVIDRSSGQTLMIDDREYGKTASTEITPDELRPEQKIYLVKEYLQGIFGINQASRQAQINRAIKMMHPDSAIIYVRWLKDNQILETQERESWEAQWVLEDKNITSDPRDPMIVTAVGEQTIRKMKDGVPVQHKVLLSVKLLLMVSPTKPKRNDNNLQTGFYVVKFKTKALNTSETTPFLLMSDSEEK